MYDKNYNYVDYTLERKGTDRETGLWQELEKYYKGRQWTETESEILSTMTRMMESYLNHEEYAGNVREREKDTEKDTEKPEPDIAGMETTESFSIKLEQILPWQDGQYVRTRDLDKVVPAWEFLLECFGGHIELGLIHYVDAVDEFKAIMGSPFIDYIRAEKAAGHIDHIGLSTHNPEVALVACDYPEVEMVMFSMNPAFDMLPPSENIETLFVEHYDDALSNVDPKRQELLRACSMHGVGITVMTPFAGGRLLDASKSPFGAAMTTTQCIEYCLSRPAVASVMTGFRMIS